MSRNAAGAYRDSVKAIADFFYRSLRVENAACIMILTLHDRFVVAEMIHI